eukprot:913818-Prorocentrum_lima.AAC.1
MRGVRGDQRSERAERGIHTRYNSIIIAKGGVEDTAVVKLGEVRELGCGRGKGSYPLGRQRGAV